MKCPEGKEYCPETKKCYKKCLKTQFRNPATRRCKNKSDIKSNPQTRKRRIITLDKYSSPSPFKEDEPKYPPCITNSKIPLYPHQLRVVSFLANHRGIIAIHDVGTGKTLTAVTAGQCFLNENPANRVIVVTPVSLQKNFMQTLEKYGVSIEDKQRFKFYTIQGFYTAYKNKLVTHEEKSMLILDEAHNIRTNQSEFDGLDDPIQNKEVGVYAKALIALGKHVKRVLLLTATPMVNLPADMINLIAIVNGEKEITTKEFYKLDFKKWLMKKVSIYVPTTEFFQEKFPKSTYHDVFLTMPPDYYREYMRIEMMPKLEEMAFYNGLRQVSNSLDGKKSPKVEWIMNHIVKSRKNHKFVVFSHYLKSGLELVMKKLKEADIPFLYINGSLSKERRDYAVSEYNSDNIKVLLISKAGGEGLDLKNTTGIILMNPSWNESANKQIIGRGVRLESHHSLSLEFRHVEIYKLFMIKPEEEKDAKTICSNLDIKNKDKFLSIDLYMRNVSILKEIEINKFYEFMKRFSIERYPLDPDGKLKGQYTVEVVDPDPYNRQPILFKRIEHFYQYDKHPYKIDHYLKTSGSEWRLFRTDDTDDLKMAWTIRRKH
jgi:SNF2 family DNA or RNA helicase